MKKLILSIYILIVACGFCTYAQQNPNSNTELIDAFNPTINTNFDNFKNKVFNKSLLNGTSSQCNTYKSYDTLGNLKEILNITYDAANNTLIANSKNKQQGIWMNNYSYSYKYNPDGNINSFVNEGWNNNIWNKYQYNYTYNGNHNLLSEQFENYVNNICQININKIYTYDENQKIQDATTWSWHNEQWTKVFLETYIFASIGNLKEKYFKNLTINLIDDKKYIYTNDTIGRMLTECLERYRNSNWGKEYFKEYSYDEQGNIASFLNEYWENNTCSFWNKHKYAYDNSKNIIADTLYHWSNYYNWIANSFSTFIYDINNNLLSELIWYKDHYHVWKTYDRFIYTYDSLGNSLNGFHEINMDDKWQRYDNSLKVFIKGFESYTSMYGSRYEITQTPIQQNTSNIFIYPNPCKGVFCLEINEPFNNTYDLKIINSLNQIVYQLADAGDNKLLVDLSHHASGIYFIHLTINDKAYTEKIIVN